MHENTTVCIHCGGQDNLFQVGVMRGRLQVGIIYFCQGCKAVLEKSSLEVFLNQDEEREAEHALH